MSDDGLLAVLGAVGVGVLAVFTATQAKKNKIPITKQFTNMVNDGCSFLTGEMAERYTDEQLKPIIIILCGTVIQIIEVIFKDD